MLMAACTPPVGGNVKASAAQIAKYNELPDLEMVTTLEKNVNAAKTDGMAFLAPDYFREASRILTECQGMLGRKSKKELANEAAKGDALLEKGRTIMGIVQYRFARELEIKKQLDQLNAPKLLPKEYEKVIAELSALIAKVEREQGGNLDKEKESLLKSMQAFEIKALQENALRECELINQDSRVRNAEKQAPMTYAEALRIYRESKDQIAAAPHDEQVILRSGARALFAARHARQINDRVAQLQMQLKLANSEGSAASSRTSFDDKAGLAEKLPLESLALREEERLMGISGALGLKDLRDQPLEGQLDAIKRAIGDMTRQLKSAISADYVNDLEARLKAANETNRSTLAELAEKDKQLAEKSAQIEALQHRQPEPAAKPEPQGKN